MLSYALYKHAYDEERGRWRKVNVINAVLILLVFYMALFIWSESPRVQRGHAVSIGRFLHTYQSEQGPGIAPQFNLRRADCSHPVFGGRCDALPNFFLHSQRVSETPSLTYANAVLAFVHAPKVGGTTMKICMGQLTSDLGKQPPFLLHQNQRFEAEIALSGDNDWLHNTGDFFAGSDAWGFCRTVVRRKCAYFIMFREPYDRLVSLYFDCRKQNVPPGRGRGDCVTTKIADWVMQLRPVLTWLQLHRQLFCKNESPESCKFFTDRLTLADLATNDTYIGLVAESLESSFAVVGLTEDYNNTYKILQKVFQVPFYDTCKAMWANRAVYSEKEVGGYKSTEELKRHTKEELLRDENVAKFLYPDVKLYEKAKEIFDKQKETLKRR